MRAAPGLAIALFALGCGRPVAARAADGFVELHDEGAYDFRYHFLDGKTGLPVRPG